MFGLGRIRLRGVDRKYIHDDEHVEDYKSAPAIGRVRFGKLCFYYRDLGVKYYVPYDYIERAFIRISETQPDDSPPIYYYRLILVHDGKEFANLIFNKEPEADPVGILGNVRDAVSSFTGAAEQFDDMTMLCIEYKGRN